MLSKSFIWAEKTLLNETEEILLNVKNQEYLLYQGLKNGDTLSRKERSILLTHTSIPLLNLKKDLQQIIGT